MKSKAELEWKIANLESDLAHEKTMRSIYENIADRYLKQVDDALRAQHEFARDVATVLGLDASYLATHNISEDFKMLANRTKDDETAAHVRAAIKKAFKA